MRFPGQFRADVGVIQVAARRRNGADSSRTRKVGAKVEYEDPPKSTVDRQNSPSMQAYLVLDSSSLSNTPCLRSSSISV